MFQRVTVLAVLSGAIAASCGFLADRSISCMPFHPMTTQSGVSIQSITLMAREERRVPPGTKPTANRDIGFASVLLRLENANQTEADVVIERIQILGVGFGGSVAMTSQAPQTIHLHPLENAANNFQLTNQQGFGGARRVKAVVTYKIGDRVQVIESDPITIDSAS